MKQHQYLRLFMMPALALILISGLSGCGGSKSKNPVASTDETGTVAEGDGFTSDGEKPTTYTTEKVESLRKIAGRPEIYGDPNLWPILQEANSDTVGQSMSVAKGIELKIPRDLTTEQIDIAHEKARQVAASNKMSRRSTKVEASPAATEAATAEAVATPVPAAPVPPAKKSGVLLPVLFVLLLVLAALAVVLFYFMKKEKSEDSQQ